MTQKTVWILADDRPGNVNQLLGIAERLGLPFERKDVHYTSWVRLPNVMRGASCVGVTQETKASLTAPWPDFVLSAGRRSFPVARFVKKQSGGRTKIIQVMNPGPLGKFWADLLILPAHDGYRGSAANIFCVSGTPGRVTRQRLQEEKEKFAAFLEKYPAPRVALIVGGATKNKPFHSGHAWQLIQDVLERNPASLLVTTSRRTPPNVVSFLEEHLPEPCFFYRFGDAFENPYFGLLAWADEIVVTGDSMSMCSECCAGGKPVFIFAPEDMIGKKHKKFHADLYAKGMAAPLGKSFAGSAQVCDAAGEIAAEIQKRFLQD